MDSIGLKTKELQSKMYLTQTHRLSLIDHWTHKGRTINFIGGGGGGGVPFLGLADDFF